MNCWHCLKKIPAMPALLLASVLAALSPQLAGQVHSAGPQPELGGPVEGLTEAERRRFYEYKTLFQKQFTPQEGLGPLFNGQSCAECHKSPTIGGSSGTAFASLGCIRIGRIAKNSMFAKMKPSDAIMGVYGLDVEPLVELGGPVIGRHSVTDKFTGQFTGLKFPSGKVPKEAQYISVRQATPLYGSGLLGAVPDSLMKDIRLAQYKKYKTQAGRAAVLSKYYGGQFEYGRFGWKAQHNSLLSFSLEAMNFEMGLTSPFDKRAKTTTGMGNLPADLKAKLPADPNDKDGKIALKLAYYLALLAPPTPGPQRKDELAGAKTFEKLGCAECHVPELKTAALVTLPDPDGSLGDAESLHQKYGQFWWQKPEGSVKQIEIKALENKTIHPYSDLLVHKMGYKLADGLPQGAAGGDYWRTTPLWGLRYRTHYLHDGRTQDLSEAIAAHQGQGDAAAVAFAKLDAKSKNEVLKFLRSL